MPFDNYSKEQIEHMEGQAKIELATIPMAELLSVRIWWNKWFLKIGHRRLGRALLRSGPRKGRSSQTQIRNDSQNDRNIRLDPTMTVEVDQRFEIRSGELLDGTMFSCFSYPGRTEVILNQLHPMHDSILSSIQSEMSEKDELQRPMLNLLLAWAEIELSHTSTETRERMEQIRFDVSRVIRSGRLSNDVAIVR